MRQAGIRSQESGVRIKAAVVLVLLTAGVLVSQTQDLPAVPGDDLVLKAMRDEMERSRQLRAAGGGEVPYFFSFSLTDADNLPFPGDRSARGQLRLRSHQPPVQRILHRLALRAKLAARRQLC
jgi:hypothetical protein